MSLRALHCGSWSWVLLGTARHPGECASGSPASGRKAEASAPPEGLRFALRALLPTLRGCCCLHLGRLFPYQGSPHRGRRKMQELEVEGSWPAANCPVRLSANLGLGTQDMCMLRVCTCFFN